MQRLIVYFMAAVGLAAFLVSIIVLGWRGWHESGKPSFTDIDGQLFVGVSGALATVFGAVVGIKKHTGTLRTWFRSDARLAAALPMPNVAEAIAMVYLVGMVLSLGFWGLDTDKTFVADALTTLAITFAGLVPGAILIAANIQEAP